MGKKEPDKWQKKSHEEWYVDSERAVLDEVRADPKIPRSKIKPKTVGLVRKLN